MKKLQYLLILVIAIGFVLSCSPSDDDISITLRDPLEVYQENLDSINKFLETHYYNEEEFQNTPDGEDFKIQFFEIDEANADKTPLSQLVTTKTVRRENIDYKVFVLNVRQGEGPRQPTFADSTLVSYTGTLLSGSVFDNSDNSIWFDLPSTVDGFAAGITDFNDATEINSNGDGTLSYKNGGIGAMFIPSGLGYFGSTRSGIPAYSPLVFTFQLRRVRETDHDGDGILSKFEDLDNDKDLNSPNFADDTDKDLTPNYREADDDNDGIPTKDENADPNGDGDPSDALDSDGDGIPDYLDNRTEV